MHACTHRLSTQEGGRERERGGEGGGEGMEEGREGREREGTPRDGERGRDREVGKKTHPTPISYRCSVAPIFTVSCVTGDNFNLLRNFLNAVPPTRTSPTLHQEPPEFQVDEIFNVPDAGTVLGGVLTRGVVHEGDPMLVGPRDDGSFVKTVVATLRRNRTPCRVARAGEAVTVTLTQVDRGDIRKVCIPWGVQLGLGRVW